MIFSSGCSPFQASTIASPQAISSGLFESHTLISPRSSAPPADPPPPPPQAAVSPSVSAPMAAVMVLVLMVTPIWPHSRASWWRDGVERAGGAAEGWSMGDGWLTGG